MSFFSAAVQTPLSHLQARLELRPSGAANAAQCFGLRIWKDVLPGRSLFHGEHLFFAPCHEKLRACFGITTSSLSCFGRCRLLKDLSLYDARAEAGHASFSNGFGCPGGRIVRVFGVVGFALAFQSKFASLLSICWHLVAQVLYARVCFIDVLQCVFYRVRRGWLAPNGRRLVFAFSCWLFMCRVPA